MMICDRQTKAEDSSIDDEAAWTATLARDPLSDGRFVYAVRTTGVYCRPVCSSRRPLRKNVEFFSTAEAAKAAGYRACRRCRPDRETEPAAVRAVERAREYLDSHADESVTLEQLGKEVYMSPFHLQRTFKHLVGLSPREYQQARRAERLKTRLKEGATVIEAGFDAGYGSGSRIYEQANSTLGMTPATYRRGGEGARIHYTIVPSAVGRLLVGATDRGICAVSLGDDDAELARSLKVEYPKADLERADDRFQRWVREIAGYLSGERHALNLPVDVDATVFQARVWRALRQIPYGATRSYSEIAAEIGAPAATRAVARACATNRAALVIPCHRVVRNDGGLGGYRWGIERKRLLLEQERSSTEEVLAVDDGR